MRGRKESCQLSEAIQRLPPELREMILKEYIETKLKEKKEMGWDKVHENILKLPFCEFKQQIVRMVICVEYPDCYFEGCCFPCFEMEGTIHKPSVSPPKEPKLLIEEDIDYNNFFRNMLLEWLQLARVVPSWCGELVKNIISIRLNHSSDDLARNITSLFLPLRCETLVGEKRNQVEADEHVFLICKQNRLFLRISSKGRGSVRFKSAAV